MEKGIKGPTDKTGGQDKNKNPREARNEDIYKSDVLGATGAIPKKGWGNDLTLARGSNDPTLAGGENKLESRVLLEIPPGFSPKIFWVRNSQIPYSDKDLLETLPEEMTGSDVQVK